MKLIITDFIAKAEHKPLEKVFSLDIIKLAARKSLEGMGDSIKNSIKIPNTSLSKIYLTSTSGSARTIFLLQVGKEKSLLVMLKLKNDKKIGANMTIKNLKFKNLLEKNLDKILRDLENNKFTEYEL